MKKISLIVLGLILFLTARLYANNSGGFQIWNSDIEEFRINDKSKIVFEQEFRWGDNAEVFYYQHYDLGLFYALNKSWTIGGGYKQVMMRTNTDTLWVNDDEPYIFATYFAEIFGFKLDNRNRLEFQYYSRDKSNGRYRNRLTIKSPWKFTKLEIQPYISDEIFLMIGNSQGFNQNRLSTGLGFNLTKNVKAELYYMFLSSKSGNTWKDYNVLGTKLRLSF